MRFACPASDDFSRPRLDHMIDLRHPLVVLASRMPWQEIEARVTQELSRKARAGVAMPELDIFDQQIQRTAVPSNARRPRVPLRMIAKMGITFLWAVLLCLLRAVAPTRSWPTFLRCSPSAAPLHGRAAFVGA